MSDEEFIYYSNLVYAKVEQLEPKYAPKIFGYILIQDIQKTELIRLAHGPEPMIKLWIQKAKAELGIIDPSISVSVSPPINITPISDLSMQFAHYSPPTRVVSSPSSFRAQPQFWGSDSQSICSDFLPSVYSDSNQTPFVCFDDLDSIHSDYFYPEAGGNSGTSLRSSRRSPMCHYFFRGFCKHGPACRYFHGLEPSNGYSPSDMYNDDHIFLPGSLEKLEIEITEILKSRKGNPISIASLPMMYFERYGRNLQAEGYLTESQRHGKAGFSLTKLLARLKNSIRLIDRPHGQHSVVLAEDAAKYMEMRGERSDPGPIVSGSRQIYLTFPAESTFTEEDVSNYFNQYGDVDDVRIPSQQQRMFGFVTFVDSGTVKTILAKGNPHYVCGARVLVKPYREKSKSIDRRYSDKFDSFYHSQLMDMEPEFQTMPRACETRSARRTMIEAQQTAELERRLAEVDLQRTASANNPYFGYHMGGEDLLNLTSADYFNNVLTDYFSNASTSEGNPRLLSANYNDQESNQGHELPDSPFNTQIPSGISTLT